VALDPVQATIPPGGSVAFTVELDIPAPAGGRTIDLTLDPASAGVVPATVVVAADQLSAGFSYTDAGLVSSATVTATLGAGAPLSAEITIQPARPPGRPVSAGP
jgi:hypothetical protein